MCLHPFFSWTRASCLPCRFMITLASRAGRLPRRSVATEPPFMLPASAKAASQGSAIYRPGTARMRTRMRLRPRLAQAVNMPATPWLPSIATRPSANTMLLR